MNKLKYYRNINNYTQKEIANYLKITQPNYANIENGKVKINFDYAKLLTKLYNINLSDLLEENSECITIHKNDFKKLIDAKKVIEEIENKYKL